MGIGSDFKNFWNDDNFVSDEQRKQINLEVELIGKFIEAREDRGISQRKLADITGLKQSTIARLEKMNHSPQVSTLLKLLAPLGYTLAIVPELNHENHKN